MYFKSWHTAPSCTSGQEVICQGQGRQRGESDINPQLRAVCSQFKIPMQLRPWQQQLVHDRCGSCWGAGRWVHTALPEVTSREEATAAAPRPTPCSPGTNQFSCTAQTSFKCTILPFTTHARTHARTHTHTHTTV